MSLHLPDWKRSAFAAIFLSFLAAVVVFWINPGGFEGQGSWFLVLLPAALVAYPLLDYIDKIAPHAETAAFWVLLIGFNFLWYWGLSYVAIRFWRFLKD
jgi:predicted membrane metal-binding protein